MHAQSCSPVSGHRQPRCLLRCSIFQQHTQLSSRRLLTSRTAPKASSRLQSQSATQHRNSCSCSPASQDSRHVQSSQNTLLLPLGLASIAAFFLCADATSAAEIPGKLHHLSDSSLHIGPHSHNVLMQLSSEEDFWGNVYAYIRYFFSVLLGTAYVAVRPIAGLFKKPVTAFFTVFALVGLLVFVSVTVNAMLGLSSNEPFQSLDTMTNY